GEHPAKRPRGARPGGLLVSSGAMKVRLSLALGAVVMGAVACAGESIKDLGDRDVDRSTARWDEPGATPDLPLDAGQPALDAGSEAGIADAGGAGDADVADADVD